MTVHAFLVDQQTGVALQRMSAPSVEFFDAMAVPVGHEIVIPDAALGDIADLETYLDGENQISFRPATVDADLALAVRKITMREAIKARRDAAETRGCQTPLGRMDTDQASQRKVNGSVTMAVIAVQNSAPFSIDWTMADNSIVTHNASEMIAAGLAVGAPAPACPTRATTLTSLVEPPQSNANLDAIDINEGWP